MGFQTGRETTADPSGVSSRDDFGDFIEAVLTDYQAAGRAEWENPPTDHLLEALGAFAHARRVEGGDQESPTWRLFAEMLLAATGYE